jgi:hypothetical protein
MGNQALTGSIANGPHAPRYTTPTTLISMARNAGTLRFAMTATWMIFTTAISAICTGVTWTNM